MDDMTAERLAKRLNVTGTIRELSGLLEEIQELIEVRGDRQDILRKLEHTYCICRKNCANINFQESDTGISLAAIKIIVDDLIFQIHNGTMRLFTCLAVAEGETEDDIDEQTLGEFRSMMIRIAIPLHNILSSHARHLIPASTNAA